VGKEMQSLSSVSSGNDVVLFGRLRSGMNVTVAASWRGRVKLFSVQPQRCTIKSTGWHWVLDAVWSREEFQLHSTGEDQSDRNTNMLNQKI
jgi:hypothetical protein